MLAVSDRHSDGVSVREDGDGVNVRQDGDGEKVGDGGKSWYLEYGWADDLLVQRFAPDLICMATVCSLSPIPQCHNKTTGNIGHRKILVLRITDNIQVSVYLY